MGFLILIVVVILGILAIGKGESNPTGQDKTSILFLLRHRPGALHRALGAIANRGINLTRIESRPMRTGNWEYLFFVDLEVLRQILDAPGQQCDLHLRRPGVGRMGAEVVDD